MAQPNLQNALPQAGHSLKPASAASIVLAFALVYFFWGSTYTAISIGGQDLPPFLMGGVRFLISGAILLLFCRLRGLRIQCSWWALLTMAIVGICLLCGSNVSLIYAEQYIPSGLSSLVLAVIPVYVALIEMSLPGGEPLPWRGWLGVAMGILSLGLLLWPSMKMVSAGNSQRVIAVLVLLIGGLFWAVGSIYARRKKLPIHTLVQASWQMLIAGAVNMLLGTVLHEWSRFHMTPRAAGSVAYLVTGGSLIGYSAYVYLIEHVPVAKVSSYAYVNPVVAVLLGIVILGERPELLEFVGMVGILFAVYLLTTSRVQKKALEVPAQDS